MAVGCTSERPRTRVGSLPFPGALSLWKAADPNALGQHVSEPMSLAALEEQSRGTVYTCRAGFIDIAHLRECADWTARLYDDIRAALRERVPTLRFTDRCKTDYEVRFAVPSSWDDLAPSARDAHEHEVALLLAQHLAYSISTWHEIATWFGESVVFFIPEDRSAFTYDDIVAHVVGVRLAAEAIEAIADGRGATFDEEMTIALEHEFERLGAVLADDTSAAAEAVEGRWWRAEECRKRQLETGIESGVVHPWLVPDFGPCAGETPEPQLLRWTEPEASRVIATAVVDVRMRVHRFRGGVGSVHRDIAAKATLSSSPGNEWEPMNIVLRRGIDAVRSSMLQELGADVDQP